jgi:hypothetical protein
MLDIILFIISDNRTIIYTNRQCSSLILSTELSYTQIVKIIQLLSDIMNRTIIYTNRKELECSWRIVDTRVLFIISEKSWMFLTIFVYDSSVDNLWEELNVFDDLRIW